MDGSSPRMRGKPSPGLSFQVPLRLIPAHAGKTVGIPRRKTPPAAHPRACGENRQRATNFHETEGSSPRMRGKRSAICPSPPATWLIPAHAGKTTTGVAKARRAAGSSPRMRGKRGYGGNVGCGYGLIPAHAGKTLHDGRPVYSVGAHPRACGENLGGNPDILYVEGSSPRMRGKRGNLGRQDLR